MGCFFNSFKKILILQIVWGVCLVFIFGCSLSSNAKFFRVKESEAISRLSANSGTVELAKNVAPAIVGVVSAGLKSNSIGSGVCVKSGGYILTNYHVISNLGKITLHLSNGTNCQGLLIYGDENMDVAILKADKAIPYLPIGNSDNLCVGEDIVAVGTPLSLTFKHTFTKGIVSALNRTLQVTNDNNEVGIMNNLIQHDASINPGNSGGPLINSAGELVGINTLKISSAEAMGFAIPIKAVESIIENSGTKKINTPFMGVAGYDAEMENLEITGFYLYDVLKNSPADMVGLKKGDVITKINGNKVVNGTDFRYEINKYDSSDYVVIEYMSENNVKRALIKFGEKTA